ncbi:MAG: right-handed parallel beta-helix repeat-containing protein [Thermodesulfobacteriota bacterium]|nr:right-handed parallel beta-helix repeat-containing protein [Thermodesulfobacteriota bacterium]
MTPGKMFRTMVCFLLVGFFSLSFSSCTFLNGVKLSDYEEVAAITNTIWGKMYFALSDIKVPNYNTVIYKDTRWRKKDGPVEINDNMYILPGVELTIEPGVTVRMGKDVLITCRGILNAVGTADQPITFTWKSENNPWEAIEFVNAIGQGKDDGGDKIVLKHCVVEHGAGVTINTSTAHVENCEFRYNVGASLRLEYSGGVVINNTFHDNSTQAQAASGNGGGINVYSNKTVLVKANTVYNNESHGGRDGGGGIYAFSYNGGDISVVENVVRDNKSDRKAGGIFGYNVKILSNRVANNRARETGGGIHAIQSLVKDNVVSGNNSPMGGGIYSESSQIVHNLVEGNDAPEGTGIFHTGAGIINRNSLVGNFHFGPASSSAITVTGNPVVEYNNIIVPDGYALTFQSHSLTPDLKAHNNYWGTASDYAIEQLVFDWLEDSDLGLVSWKFNRKHLVDTAYPLPENANAESMIRTDTTEANTIRGSIIQDTILGDRGIHDYIVTGNLLVKEGVKLTIKPGTTLYLKKDVSIRVRGGLVAAGEAGSVVTFTGNAAAPWGNILFENRSLDLEGKAVQAERGVKSLLRHCIVEKGSGIVMDGQGGDVLNTVVSDNKGTGIRIKEVPVSIKNCDIRNNVSTSDGGGIYIYGSKRVFVHDNDIAGNRAADGGGIFAYGYQSNAAVDIRHNRITGNTSDGSGGGIWTSRSAIVDNTIAGNKTEKKGGGVYTSYAVIQGNRISGNTAAKGGGFYAEANSTIQGNSVVDNKCLSGLGGGAYINFWGMSMHNKTIAHNVIMRNAAEGEGKTGGICIKGELTFIGNCIQDNAGLELTNLNSSDEKDLSAEYCFWGTMSPARIAAEVHDGHDDPSLSMVDYVPFAKTKKAALSQKIPEEEK